MTTEIEGWSFLSSQKKKFGVPFIYKNEGWHLNMVSRAIVGKKKTFLSWHPILPIEFSTKNVLLTHILSKKSFGYKKVEIVTLAWFNIRPG
jgi:hypothetical protein